MFGRKSKLFFCHVKTNYKILYDMPPDFFDKVYSRVVSYYCIFGFAKAIFRENLMTTDDIGE